MSPRGLSSSVIVPDHIDWERHYSQLTLSHLCGMNESELAGVDPLAMNLIVARGIVVGVMFWISHIIKPL